MKRITYIFLVLIGVMLTACSIGQDKKRFKCTKWTIENRNSSVANRIAIIQDQVLGSEATFEFFDNQIRMSFQGDQVVFTENKDGHYMYEKPYYMGNKQGKIRYHLCPRTEGGFVHSLDLYFYVDYDDCGEASFSRSW